MPLGLFDCKGVNKMKGSFIVPYMLGGILTLTAWTNSQPSNDQNSQNTAQDSAKYTINTDTTKVQIEAPTPEEFTPYVTEAMMRNGEVLYVMNTGDTICRRGGSLAWRNNNPGNIIYGSFARENGAMAKGTRSFAVFPDAESGRAALVALLKTDKYNNLTISRAIEKYAPPKENDVELYRRKLRKMTGLNLNIKICDLDTAQLERVTDAICVIEGWTVGKEHVRPSKQTLMADLKEKAICDSMALTL